MDETPLVMRDHVRKSPAETPMTKMQASLSRLPRQTSILRDVRRRRSTAVIIISEGFLRCLSSLLLSPFVLTTDLVLLLGGEVVLDVECLANLLRRLALDHVRNGLATNIEKSLDIEVVGSLKCVKSVCALNVLLTYQNDFEKHLLIDLHELLIPLLDLGRLLARITLLVSGLLDIVLVVLTPFDDLL